LYHHRVDLILRQCLTHEEVEKVMHDYHSGAYGGHLPSLLATIQKVMRSRYFWLSIFKYFVEVVRKCHPYQVFMNKSHAHPTHLHLFITIGPLIKWGIDFTTCHSTFCYGHKCIIVVIDYFTKWVETMPTFTNDGNVATLFILNHIFTINNMMLESTSNLGFHQEHSYSYYP
jgi:hypothetical protein